MSNIADQLALDELRQQIEKDESRGSGAPTASTPGTKYIRTDDPSLYYKIDDEWVKIGNVS